MADERVQRRLAAILAADVVGYSRLMGEDEVGTRQRFNAHLHELIEPAIANRQGRIVKTTGDALLVEFASVVDAVQCAVEIQKGNYAEAHGLGAWCHWHLFLHAEHPKSRESMLAHAGAVRQLRTTEAAPLAYAALALAHFAEHRKTALGMVDRALVHNGNSMHANAIGAVINVFMGQWEAAILLAEEALRLSPFDPSRYMACAAISHGKYMLDDLSGAEAGAREALQINPRHLPSLLLLATILVDIGQL